MANATKLVLTASVTHRKGEHAKNPCLSVVTIRLGDAIVAGATLGGGKCYTPAQALKEFEKDGKLKTRRFKLHKGYETAKLGGLVC